MMKLRNGRREDAIRSWLKRRFSPVLVESLLDQYAPFRQATRQSQTSKDFGFGRVPVDIERGIPLDDAA